MRTRYGSHEYLVTRLEGRQPVKGSGALGQRHVQQLMRSATPSPDALVILIIVDHDQSRILFANRLLHHLFGSKVGKTPIILQHRVYGLMVYEHTVYGVMVYLYGVSLWSVSME